MVMAIGVDLIENQRIKESIARFGERFLNRIYTPNELVYCQGRIPALAARWAAKEAMSKALGTGIGVISWQEIEVINQANGQPTLYLHGEAKRLADEGGLTHIEVSLSHTKEYAVAFIVGE